MLKSASKTIKEKFFCNKQILYFLLAYFVPLSFIIVYFITAYARYPDIDLPIGWDTPWYINAINLAKTGMFMKVFQLGSYANFLYPVLVSVLPLNAFQIETYAPILLTALLPLIAYVFVKTTSSYNANLAMVFSLAWYPIYRLVGLHSNLFGLILSMLATAIFLDKSIFGARKSVLSIVIIMVSSFIHFEVTLFFTLLILITLVISKTEDRSKRLILLIASIFPSLVLYSYGKIYRLQTEGALATGSGMISSEIVFYSLGSYCIPLALSGMYYVFSKKGKSNYDLFVLSWAFLTILLYLLTFFFPLKNFAERALVLFPSLFLIIPLVKGLLSRFSKTNYKQLHNALSIVVISTLLVTAFLTAGFAYNYYPKIFLNKEIYDELCYLENYSISNNVSLLFVYNLANPGVVEFYANWVSAIVGESLSYYGDLFDLLSLRSGYDNPISKRLYTHGSFEEKTLSSLSNYEITLVSQFYTGANPVIQSLSEELCENVWSINLAKLMAQPEISFSTFSLWNQSGTGGWYYNEVFDAVSIYSGMTENPYALLYLDFLQEGYYNLSLSYWDASLGSGLKIFVNDELTEVIYYNATATFNISEIKDIFLNKSTNIIKIEVFIDSPSSKYFARLRSITISPNPYSSSD